MSFANAHQAAMKMQSKKGRCLHFSDGIIGDSKDGKR